MPAYAKLFWKVLVFKTSHNQNGLSSLIALLLSNTIGSLIFLLQTANGPPGWIVTVLLEQQILKLSWILLQKMQMSADDQNSFEGEGCPIRHRFGFWENSTDIYLISLHPILAYFVLMTNRLMVGHVKTMRCNFVVLSHFLKFKLYWWIKHWKNEYDFIIVMYSSQDKNCL